VEWEEEDQARPGAPPRPRLFWARKDVWRARCFLQPRSRRILGILPGRWFDDRSRKSGTATGETITRGRSAGVEALTAPIDADIAAAPGNFSLDCSTHSISRAAVCLWTIDCAQVALQPACPVRRTRPVQRDGALTGTEANADAHVVDGRLQALKAEDQRLLTWRIATGTPPTSVQRRCKAVQSQQSQSKGMEGFQTVHHLLRSCVRPAAPGRPGFSPKLHPHHFRPHPLQSLLQGFSASTIGAITVYVQVRSRKRVCESISEDGAVRVRKCHSKFGKCRAALWALGFAFRTLYLRQMRRIERQTPQEPTLAPYCSLAMVEFRPNPVARRRAPGLPIPASDDRRPNRPLAPTLVALARRIPLCLPALVPSMCLPSLLSEKHDMSYPRSWLGRPRRSSASRRVQFELKYPGSDV
jgi:hypothetical protein